MPKPLALILIFSVMALTTACDELDDLLGIEESVPSNIDPDLFSDESLFDCVALSGASSKENFQDLVCAGVGITSLDGLEQFPNIRSLLINSNRLSSVDLSIFPKLAFVDLSNNRLNEIDISQNPKLVEVLLDQNNLDSLDTSKNPLLEVLVLSDTGISHLDLSTNLLLEELILDENAFSGDMAMGDLILTNNTKLINLNLFGNDITNIDLSTNVNLDKVDLSQNSLSTLNVLANTNISELRVSGNSLVTLNLQNFDELTILVAENNVLEEVRLPLTQKLKFAFLANNNISCGRVSCMSGDIFNIPADSDFIQLDLSNNALTSDGFIVTGLLFTELILSGNLGLAGELDISPLIELVELRVDGTGITNFNFGPGVNTANNVFQQFDLQVLTAFDTVNLNAATKSLLDDMEALKTSHPKYPDASQLLYVYEAD